jgi:hypothetical protein
MRNTYTWQEERQMLEDSYARRLLIEHNIKEVTTQRQAKNGTREFEFPCPASPYYQSNKKGYAKRLRLAVFESGYVRRQNGTTDRAYQINPQYKQQTRVVHMDASGKIKVKEFTSNARALIHNPLTRMVYMLNYYLKNYKKYE